MDKQDSLYDHSASPKKPDDAGPKHGEIAPTNARARTMRTSILTVVLMLSLLGAAAYFAYLNDEKGKHPEFEDVKVEDMVSTPRNPTGRVNTLQYSLPDVTRSLDQISSENPKFPRAPRDPEELAVATESVRRANEYVQAKEWDEAERYARRALEIWPAMNVAQRMLGAIYTQKGQFDQAITMLTQALTTDPFSAETYSNLATAYMHKGQLDKAENYLNTALKMRPNFVVANLNLGLLYLATGRYDWAAEYLELAVEQMPANTKIRNNLAVSLMRIGQYEDSRQHLQFIIDRDATMAHAYFNMAITYTLEGDFEEALHWISRGAKQCSPIAFQQFISDPDFQELQALPEFKQMMQGFFGELPELQG